MKHIKVIDIMTSPVLTVPLDATIREVVGMLKSNRISGAPVVDAEGHLCGVVTEGDLVAAHAGIGGGSELEYNRRGSAEIVPATCAFAADIMSARPVVAHEDETVTDVARLMLRHHINRIPICRGDDLVGIVTRADVLSVFERSVTWILADVRASIREDLLMDPDRLDVVVVNNSVSVRGAIADNCNVELVRMILAQIDGVTTVDVSGLYRAKGEQKVGAA